MSSVRPETGAEVVRLLEQHAADRVERARLQAKIKQAGILLRVQEDLVSLMPPVSPLLDIRV